jgi:urease accessory protein
MKLDQPARNVASPSPAAIAAERDFAANRARGRIALSVTGTGGTIRRQRVHESGSLRVRFPGAPAEELEAVLLNTAGGMAGGDVFDIEVSVGESAKLVVTGVAAEKIYRSLGPPAVVNLRIQVEPGGALVWVPQETILFDNAVLSRRIEVDLAEGAHLLLVEPVVFGRAGMGEVMKRGELQDHWRVRRNGRLVYAESIRLNADIAGTLSEPAVANGGLAVATALMIPGDEARAEAVRTIQSEFRGEVGVSTWNGQTVVRFCARDGAGLRHDLARVLGTLRTAPLPRLWLN